MNDISKVVILERYLFQMNYEKYKIIGHMKERKKEASIWSPDYRPVFVVFCFLGRNYGSGRVT